MQIKTVLHLFIITLILFGCKKNQKEAVPNLPFDITLNLTLPSYSPITGVGGWCYAQGGIRGLVIYRRSVDEFVAFDRFSPASPNENGCETPLAVSASNGLQLDDLCSDALFSLVDGSPISNSDSGLRQYQTQFDGGSMLRIFN